MLTALSISEPALAAPKLSLWTKLQRLDWLLFALVIGLSCASVVVVYSATFASESAEFRNAYRSQAMWLGLGLIGFFVMALTPYYFWVRHALFLAVGALVLLVLVLFIGSTVFGAKSWIRLGPVGLQPAEFAKLAFIIFIAWFFAVYENRGIFMFMATLCATGVPVLLILGQPDLGSALVFVPVAYAVMFVAGVRKLYLALPIVAVVALCAFVYICLHPSDPNQTPDVPFLKKYQENRILTFLDPSRDPQGAGWTINQSLIAIGSGGFEGKGFLQGTTIMLGFLPRNIAYNDFIFPVVCEQWGFIGGAGLIMALGLLLLWIVRIAAGATDNTGTLLAVGVAAMLFTHIFVNIGMTIKVVPITGIPLPFVSYGGTFLVVCLAALGLVQSIWIHRRS